MQLRGANPRLRSGAETGRTPCPKGGGQEKLSHVRGQGQRPRVPESDSTGTAERSYPTSEGRGGRGGVPGDKRSYPASEVRGGDWEEIPRVRGQGQRLGGDTPSPKPKARAAGRRSYPTALSPRPGAAGGRPTPGPHARGHGRWPGEATPPPRSCGCQAQEGLEELSHVEGQEGRR